VPSGEAPDPFGGAASRKSLAPLIAALGVAQVISWGTLFYSIAVLGPALREATGASDLLLFASFSAGLLISGLVAPWIGREIDARGGRAILSIGSLGGAAACAVLALASGPVSLAAGWLLAGAAMAATLYDPAFATLHQLAGPSYRRSVTALTLYGGFASTVFWPLAQTLLEAYGVRIAYLVFAALHLGVCLPLHLRFVPRGAHDVHAAGSGTARVATAPDPRRAFLWLATALSIASFAAAALSAHLIALLREGGMSAREAVLVGALIGPMQVVGRVMEFAFARSISPVAAGTIAFAALAASLAMLPFAGGVFALAVGFAILYGWSNGVMTITRGTVPEVLFGSRGYGALLGRLAQPQFLARAFAPAAMAGVLALPAGRAVALAALAVGGVVALGAYWRAADRPRE